MHSCKARTAVVAAAKVSVTSAKVCAAEMATATMPATEMAAATVPAAAMAPTPTPAERHTRQHGRNHNHGYPNS
jgi:hypothetical protein